VCEEENVGIEFVERVERKTEISKEIVKEASEEIRIDEI
jgi:hypothetical protein